MATERRGFCDLNRSHNILSCPSERWCELSKTQRFLKIIIVLGHQESLEAALANLGCPVMLLQTHVLFCSQLCCLKRLLLSDRWGQSNCSPQIVSPWLKFRKTSFRSRLYYNVYLATCMQWSFGFLKHTFLYICRRWKDKKRKKLRR